jgi:hypothetical protein
MGPAGFEHPSEPKRETAGDAQSGAKSGALSGDSTAGVTPPTIATDPDLAVVAAAWAALPAAVRAGVVALVRAALPAGGPGPSDAANGPQSPGKGFPQSTTPGV